MRRPSCWGRWGADANLLAATKLLGALGGGRQSARGRQAAGGAGGRTPSAPKALGAKPRLLGALGAAAELLAATKLLGVLGAAAELLAATKLMGANDQLLETCLVEKKYYWPQ